jgi:hypothetical protein
MCVLVATNRDLCRSHPGQDLYFRLAVVPIQVPPLRRRREDIPQLRLSVPPGDSSNLSHLHPTPWTCWSTIAGRETREAGEITRASVLCGRSPVTADHRAPGSSTARVPAGRLRRLSARYGSAGDGTAIIDTLNIIRDIVPDRSSLGDRHSTLANNVVTAMPREKSFIRAA